MLVVPSATAHPNKAAPSYCGHAVTAKQFRTFSAKVWDESLWRRKGGDPKQTTIRAAHRKIACALGPGHRAAMKRTWHKDRRAYNRHRSHKLAEQRWRNAITPPGMAVLEAIAACESGGDPTAVSPDGSYRGKYQFDYSTWEEIGGSGDPAAASEQEQDERAAALYRQRGPSPWPVCGV